MHPTGTRHSHDGIRVWLEPSSRNALRWSSSDIFVFLTQRGLQVCCLCCTEAIARGHNVGSECVYCRIQGQTTQHGQHFSRMPAATQDNKQMGRRMFAASLGDTGPLRHREQMEEKLREESSRLSPKTDQNVWGSKWTHE